MDHEGWQEAVANPVMSELSKTKSRSSLQMPGVKKKVTKRLDHSSCGKGSKQLATKKVPPSQQGVVAGKILHMQLVSKALHKGSG